MSRIRANNITDQTGNGAPNAPHGLVVTGILTATGNVSISGTVTYEDVTNIDSIGIITARSGVAYGTGIGATISSPATNTLALGTNGSERLRITSDGKVGISTDNPQALLHLNDSANSAIMFGNSTNGYKIRANVTSSNDYGLLIEDEDGVDLYRATSSTGTSNADTHIFYTSGSEKVRIKAASNGDGLIGINSSSPTVYAVDANSSLLNGGISYNCDNSANGSTNLKFTFSNRDSGSHYFRFGYSDNMNTRGMIQYYRPNSALSEDELRFWVGGAEKIRFTSTGGIGIATVGDGSTNGSIGVGSTGQVLTSQGPGYPSIWKGGATRILEVVSSPCDGSVINSSRGDVTFQNVTAVQDLTTSFADITGSVISYCPPVGTKQVIYEFNFQNSRLDALVMSHYKLYLDSDEVTKARSEMAGEDFCARTSFKWIFNIGGSADTTVGRVASWNTHKTMKWQAEDYGSSYDAQLHSTNWWNTTGDDQFSMPVLTITAIGS